MFHFEALALDYQKLGHQLLFIYQNFAIIRCRVCD